MGQGVCCQSNELEDVEVTLGGTYEEKVVDALGGMRLRLRMGRPSDQAVLEEHFCERSQVGAGVAGDRILRLCFSRFCVDPMSVVLFAEMVDPPQTSLGISVVTFASESESWWHSLRVAEAARGKGLAKLLVKESAMLCIQRQGENSISRWGVVNTNEVMVGWSERMKLKGPHSYVHYQVKKIPPEKTMEELLPQGWTSRKATLQDVNMIWSYVSRERGSWVVSGSEYGTPNFLKYGSLGTMTPRHLKTYIAGQPLPEKDRWGRGGSCHMAPLVFDEAGELVGVCVYYLEPWPLQDVPPNDDKCVYWGYCDGTLEGIKAVLVAMGYETRNEGLICLHGYFPDIDSLIAEFAKESSPVQRFTATTEQIFEWDNKKLAA